MTQTVDSEGKPQLKEANNRYLVFFYDCDDTGGQCDTLQFNACRRLSEGQCDQDQRVERRLRQDQGLYRQQRLGLRSIQVVPTGKAGVSYAGDGPARSTRSLVREHADEAIPDQQRSEA